VHGAENIKSRKYLGLFVNEDYPIEEEEEVRRKCFGK